MDLTIREHIIKTCEAMELDPGFGEVRIVFKDHTVYDVKELKIRTAKEILNK